MWSLPPEKVNEPELDENELYEEVLSFIDSSNIRMENETNPIYAVSKSSVASPTPTTSYGLGARPCAQVITNFLLTKIDFYRFLFELEDFMDEEAGNRYCLCCILLTYIVIT